MNVFVLLVLLFVLWIFYGIIVIGVRRKEPVSHSVLSGAVFGAWLMIIIFHIARW